MIQLPEFILISLSVLVRLPRSPKRKKLVKEDKIKVENLEASI